MGLKLAWNNERAWQRLQLGDYDLHGHLFSRDGLEKSPFFVMDSSRGGLGIWLEAEIEQGTEVILEFKKMDFWPKNKGVHSVKNWHQKSESIAVVGKIVWCRSNEDNGGFRIGFNPIGENCQRNLRNHIANHISNYQEHLERSCKATR